MVHGKIYGKNHQRITSLAHAFHLPVQATLSTLLRRQNLGSKAPSYFEISAPILRVTAQRRGTSDGNNTVPSNLLTRYHKIRAIPALPVPRRQHWKGGRWFLRHFVLHSSLPRKSISKAASVRQSFITVMYLIITYIRDSKDFLSPKINTENLYFFLNRRNFARAIHDPKNMSEPLSRG